MQITTLPRDKVTPNPDQPRRHFDVDALAELADNIRVHGIVQPLTVVTRDEGWLIVAGERRWRAAGIAGLPDVPCVIRDDLDAAAVHVIATTENLLRADMLPSEEARAVRRMIDDGMAADPADVASQLGKSESWVKRGLALLKLRDDLLDAVDTGEISATNGAYIGHLSDSSQQAVANKLNAGELDTQGKIRTFARALWHGEQQMGLFLDEPDEEVDAAKQACREKIARQRATLEKRIGNVHTALMDLATATPAELAVGLGVDAHGLARQLDAIARGATTLAGKVATAIEMQRME